MPDGNEILPYTEMCVREGQSLQRGMNFSKRPDASVLLMSIRPGAPYRDRLEEGGRVLIYEGHDARKDTIQGDPKTLDQPFELPSGTLTENGRFFNAAKAHAERGHPAHQVRVYEKIRDGIWTYNGLFDLIDAWIESDGTRKVFKFRLVLRNSVPTPTQGQEALEFSRMIPSSVKQEVWKRDQGKCCQCGATDHLHFDHILPWSKGGTSLLVENIQLLCARHNLAKSARIE